jgi:hypothetical protein
MGIDFKRLLYSDAGKNIISVVLGIGLASLFQKVCKDKDCIIFSGPIISEVDNKIFKHDDNCYKYDIISTSCDKDKRIIEMSTDLSTMGIESPSVYDYIEHMQNYITRYFY